MDIASLVGMLLGMGMVVYGIIDSGGTSAFGTFIDVASVAITFGGSLSSISGGDTKTGSFSFLGLFIVLLSALGYALYLVTMSQLKIGQMKGLLLTFYVFLFGGILLFIGTETISQLQPISKWHTAGNLILLALIPTVVSNLALVRAVKSIGSTLTSVLGAMEPVTAVCVGIFLFGEAFTTSIGVGIALIIAAVIVIILKR